MRLALAALLAVHAAVQAALLSAPGVDVQRRNEQLVLSPRLLRLRGGEDDEQDADEDESSKRALSRGEIIAKLNEVPTFCVTNEEGGVAMFRMKETDEKGVPRFRASVCFFLEPEEAKAAMQAMQLAMPQTKLKLSLHGLGAAFEHCRGWQAVANSTLAFDEEAAAAAAKEELPTTPAGEPVEMKIMGNHALVNSTSDSMRQMVEEHGMQAGCWSLPVFISNELQSKSILPAFVRPSDLKNTWLAAGRTEDSMPQDIVVIDRAHARATLAPRPSPALNPCAHCSARSRSARARRPNAHRHERLDAAAFRAFGRGGTTGARARGSRRRGHSGRGREGG